MIWNSKRRGNEALHALRDECESAIADIRENNPVTACEAHSSISRGLIQLLRCKIAEIDYGEEMAAGLKMTVAKVAGIVAALLMVCYALIDNIPFLVKLFLGD